MTLLFWFDLFLEARAEILAKISLFFWSIWRHQEDISKLTWPLCKKPPVATVIETDFQPLVASDMFLMTEDFIKFNFLDCVSNIWAKMQLQNKFDPHGDLHDSCKVCTMLSRKWQNLAESCVYDQCVRLFYPKRRFFLFEWMRT